MMGCKRTLSEEDVVPSALVMTAQVLASSEPGFDPTLGCELLGECFVGGVALSILLAEVATGKAEEAEQLAVIEALQSSMEEQRQQLADLQGMVQRNHELEVEATCRSGRTPIVSAEAASDAPPTWRRWLR